MIVFRLFHVFIVIIMHSSLLMFMFISLFISGYLFFAFIEVKRFLNLGINLLMITFIWLFISFIVFIGLVFCCSIIIYFLFLIVESNPLILIFMFTVNFYFFILRLVYLLMIFFMFMKNSVFMIMIYFYFILILEIVGE